MFAGLLESDTLTVTVDVPAVVGVPATVQPVRCRPAGSVPCEMEQLYGDVPPITPISALYGICTVPLGSVDVVSFSGAGAMVIDSGPEMVIAGLLVSVTFTVTVEVCAVVGIPLTVQPLRTRPPGSVPLVMMQE